ncbi:MAG: hypothetical protein IPM59_09860 [Chloracidobacterium sp.]|nr:hypothetical protein [Chloracidobacterium sp.]
MFTSCSMVCKAVRWYLFFALFIAAAAAGASAQAVRLRSQTAPPCSSSQGDSLRYADLFGENQIAVQGSYGCRGAFIYDISDPEAPVLANYYDPIRPGTSSTHEQFLEAVILNGIGYFGSGNGGGVYIVDLANPYQPALMGRVTSASGGGHNSIHEMVIFMQDGKTYLLENFNGTSNKIMKFIDVSDPGAPIFIRDLNPSEPQWVHAMVIKGDRLYTSGWGNTSSRGRTEIYQIANIASQPATLLGFIDDQTGITAGNSMHSSWPSEDQHYLYSAREIGNSNATSPGDIRVYDIQNPAQPLLIRKISMVDIGINAVTPHNPVVKGDKLYVSWYHAGLQVFDLSDDPTNPQRVGQYDTYQPAFSKEDQKEIDAFEPWDMVCGRSLSTDLGVTGYQGAWAVYPFLGEDRVLVGDLAKGLFIVDASHLTTQSRNQVSDYDGDGRTDISVWTPSSGDWLIELSSSQTAIDPHFGLPGDIITPGDYDGDQVVDLAVFRPSAGMWYAERSSLGFIGFQFGSNGDVPVAADYDADGKTDFAIWRPSTGIWYVVQSTLGFRAAQWGSSSDKPMIGDYDNDGKADMTVWRPANGFWYTLQSSSTIPAVRAFGTAGDKPLMADFDGNGVSDLAVYRPSTGYWYIMDPVTSAFKSYAFGLTEDIAVPADYDGDGKSDVAVFRPSSNTWFRINSTNGGFAIQAFGATGDKPAPSSVQPN